MTIFVPNVPTLGNDDYKNQAKQDGGNLQESSIAGVETDGSKPSGQAQELISKMENEGTKVKYEIIEDKQITVIGGDDKTTLLIVIVAVCLVVIVVLLILVRYFYLKFSAEKVKAE